jgi:hypothetical protein
MSTNGGASWSGLANNTAAAVAELMPVAGSTGAVYALTTTSRTPQALGTAPVITDEPVAVEAPVAATTSATSLLAWVIAGLAAAALVFALVYDAARRSKRPATAGTVRPQRPQPQPVVNR